MTIATIAAAVAECFKSADVTANIAEKVRLVFAGVKPAKRKELRTTFYDAIREEDGRDADGKLVTARKLSERTKRAYIAARQAVSHLFAKKGSANSRKKKGGKVIVIPIARKGVSAMCKAAISAIRDADSLPYQAEAGIAAWQALDAVCGVLKKTK